MLYLLNFPLRKTLRTTYSDVKNLQSQDDVQSINLSYTPFSLELRSTENGLY